MKALTVAFIPIRFLFYMDNTQNMYKFAKHYNIMIESNDYITVFKVLSSWNKNIRVLNPIVVSYPYLIQRRNIDSINLASSNKKCVYLHL